MDVGDLRAKLLEAAHVQAQAAIDRGEDADEAGAHALAARTLVEALAAARDIAEDIEAPARPSA